MADLQHLADGMLEAASTVLGRLVELPVAASATSQSTHENSILIDTGSLVTLAEIPSMGVHVVVRFRSDDISRVVGLMLGGMDDSDMGAMQLSIVSETVSQIAASMAEELAKGVGASIDGIHADLCNDATNLPAPPFATYAGSIQIGNDLAAELAIDFDGIAASKLSGPPPAEPEALKPQPVQPQAAAASPVKAPKAQPVAFAAMTPTTRASQGGNNLDLVHDVPLQISAVLGKTALTLRDVVTLSSGSVFELDKLSSDPIDLYVNNILIARGEVVVVDDKFAVKISELNPTVE